MLSRNIRLSLLNIIISFYLSLPSFAGFVSISDFTEGEESISKRGVWIHFEKDLHSIPPEDLCTLHEEAIFTSSTIQWDNDKDDYNTLAQKVLENKKISLVRIWGIKDGTELDYAKNFLNIVLKEAETGFERSFSSHFPYGDKNQDITHEQKAWEEYVKSYAKK